MFSPCNVVEAIVKVLYWEFSSLCNTIRGSLFGKSRLSLWRSIKAFQSLLLPQYHVSLARKQRLTSLLGESVMAVSGADCAQWLHGGRWREQSCPASSLVLNQPSASSSERAAPATSWLTPHHQLPLSGACTAGGRCSMATSLFLSDTAFPHCAVDIWGTSWTQTRDVLYRWEKGFRLLKLKV